MNCPICGRRMAEFKNPRRYQCLTSDGDHEKIIKAVERSERNRESAKRQGLGKRGEGFTKGNRKGRKR